MTITFKINTFLEKRDKYLRALSFFSLFLGGAWVLHYQIILILSNHQQELREGAMIYLTSQLLNGVTPYSIKSLPVDANPYGILFHLISYPFAYLFGSTLLVHRGIAGFFILLSSIVVYLWGRFIHLPRIMSASCALVLYISLMYGVTPVARPDSLGTFLFLLSLYIPLRLNFSYKSLAITACLGIAIFHTKLYFYTSELIIGGYLLIYISKIKAVIFFFFSIIALSISLTLSIFIFETHIHLVLGSMVTAASYGIDSVISQSYFFLKNYSPLLIVGIISYVSYIFKNNLVIIERKPIFSLKNFQLPLLLNYQIKFTEFCGLLSLLFLLVFFGKNDGAWMTYFYQLLTPFVLLIFGRYLLLSLGISLSSLIMVFCGLRMFYLYYPTTEGIKNNSGWAEVREIVRNNDHVFGSPAITSLLIENNKEIYDTGVSGHSFIANIPPKFFEKHISKINGNIEAQNNVYRNDVLNKIKDHIFDVLILTGNEMVFVKDDLLKAGYKKISTIPVTMAQNGQFWELEVWKYISNQDLN